VGSKLWFSGEIRPFLDVPAVDPCSKCLLRDISNPTKRETYEFLTNIWRALLVIYEKSVDLDKR
jgi:hypothetical protein